MKKKEKAITLFLLIMLILSISIILFRNSYIKQKQNIIANSIEEELVKNVNTPKETLDNQIVLENGEIGLIVIPGINIEAPIREGTSSEILKYSVGHFEETNLWDGNVALASHNGGSSAHYFSRINELKNGEEIIYITSMGERRYQVVENKIIEETNVSILEETEENIITLVTCVKGEKSKRQCIIGKEIN